MTIHFKHMACLGMSLLTLACSDSNDSEQRSDNTGAFIDSAVEGLRWSSASQAGQTDQAGAFSYQTGESVTFFLGNLRLGAVDGALTLTPYELFGLPRDNASADPRPINLARLLQTLDSDQDARNGIAIPSALTSNPLPSINFAQDPGDFATDNAVLQVLALAGRGHLQPAVSSARHLSSSIAAINALNGAPNQGPTARPGSNISSGDNTTVMLNGSGSSDPEGRIFSYQWQELSTIGLSFSDPFGSTSEVQIPNVAGAQTATIALRVQDAFGAMDTGVMTLNIADTDQDSVPPNALAGQDQSIQEGLQATLNGSNSSDPDGQIRAYQWRQISKLPIALTDSGSAMARFVAPDVSINTAAEFELVVTDNDGNQARDRIVVTIQDVGGNRPPVADAGGHLQVAEGETLQLNGSGSDSDGSIASYQWVDRSGRFGDFGDSSSRVITLQAPQVEQTEVLEFALIVTDEEGARGMDVIDITVLESSNVNQLPIADAGEDLQVQAGDQVILNGSQSNDPDGDSLSYSWRQDDDNPPLSLNNAQSAQASFTAPSVAQATTYQFELNVNDGNGGSAQDRVEIAVQPQPAGNQPPEVSIAAPDKTQVAPGEFVDLNASASDPEGDQLSFAWDDLGDGCNGSFMPPDTAKTTYTAPNTTENRDCELRVVVNDGRGGQAQDSVTVTVTNTPSSERNMFLEMCLDQSPVAEFCLLFEQFCDPGQSAASDFCIPNDPAELCAIPQLGPILAEGAGAQCGDDEPQPGEPSQCDPFDPTSFPNCGPDDIGQLCIVPGIGDLLGALGQCGDEDPGDPGDPDPSEPVSCDPFDPTSYPNCGPDDIGQACAVPGFGELLSALGQCPDDDPSDPAEPDPASCDPFDPTSYTSCGPDDVGQLCAVPGFGTLLSALGQCGDDEPGEDPDPADPATCDPFDPTSYPNCGPDDLGQLCAYPGFGELLGALGQCPQDPDEPADPEDPPAQCDPFDPTSYPSCGPSDIGRICREFENPGVPDPFGFQDMFCGALAA